MDNSLPENLLHINSTLSSTRWRLNRDGLLMAESWILASDPEFASFPKSNRDATSVHNRCLLFLIHVFVGSDEHGRPGMLATCGSDL